MKKILPVENNIKVRLTSYAAVAGVVIATGSNVNAQVVYSGVKDTLVTGHLTPFELDLDGDSQADFKFGIWLQSLSYNYNSAYIKQERSGSYLNSWMEKGNVQAVGEGLMISNYGYVGSGTLNWAYSGNSWNLASYVISAGSPVGFAGAGDQFIGLRFWIGADLHYGWARVNIPTLSNKIKIVDWAYESTPGKAIAAGILETNLTAADTVHGSFDVAIDFSQTVADFNADSIVVTNGSITSLTGSGTSYVLSILPVTQGEVTIKLKEGAATYLTNIKSLQKEISTYYDSYPVPSLSAVADSIHSITAVVTVEFNEEIQGLTVDDFTITNGSAANLQTITAGKKYTIDVTADVAGNVNVQLPVNKVVDNSGNGNLAASLDYTYVKDILDVNLSAADTVHGSYEITIDFSEPVTDFNQDSIVITNGSIISLTGSGSSYTLSIEPITQGDVKVNLKEGAATYLTDTKSLAKEITTYYDSYPVPSLSTIADSIHTVTAVVTVEFNEEIQALSANDFSITNGSAANLQTVTAGKKYTIDVTANVAGTVNVVLPVNKVEDITGNGNLEGSLSYTYVRDILNVDLTAADTVHGSYDVAVDFSESVTDFNQDSIVVTNGSISSLTGSGSSYTLSIQPITQGDVTIELKEGAATYLSDIKSPQKVIKTYYDSYPVATLSTDSATVHTKTIPVTVEFDEEVFGLTLDDFIITNGSAGNLQTNVAGRNFTIDVTADAAGTVTVQLPVNKVIDNTRNGNLASSVEFTYVAPNAVQNFDANEIKLYPVPATDVLNIETYESARITLTDMNGKVVYQQDNVLKLNLDVSGFDRGMYLVSITTSKNIINKKILIQ